MTCDAWRVTRYIQARHCTPIGYRLIFSPRVWGFVCSSPNSPHLAVVLRRHEQVEEGNGRLGVVAATEAEPPEHGAEPEQIVTKTQWGKAQIVAKKQWGKTQIVTEQQRGTKLGAHMNCLAILAANTSGLMKSVW